MSTCCCSAARIFYLLAPSVNIFFSLFHGSHANIIIQTYCQGAWKGNMIVMKTCMTGMSLNSCLHPVCSWVSPTGTTFKRFCHKKCLSLNNINIKQINPHRVSLYWSVCRRNVLITFPVKEVVAPAWSISFISSPPFEEKIPPKALQQMTLFLYF